jgi:hypothetical protein
VVTFFSCCSYLHFLPLISLASDLEVVVPFLNVIFVSLLPLVSLASDLEVVVPFLNVVSVSLLYFGLVSSLFFQNVVQGAGFRKNRCTPV